MIIKLSLDDIKPREDTARVLARIEKFLNELDPADRVDITLTALWSP